MTRHRAFPARPAHPTAAPPAVPGGHPDPAAAAPPAAAGSPGCTWCAGAGEVLALPVVAGVVVDQDVALVPCACTVAARRGDRLVLAALAGRAAAGDPVPTLRELATVLDRPVSSMHAGVLRLERAGRVRRGGPCQARALQLVRPTTEEAP